MYKDSNAHLKKRLSQKFRKSLSEQEILEITDSLFFLAKAKIEYLKQKKGGISEK